MRTLEEYLSLPYKMKIVSNADKDGYIIFSPYFIAVGSAPEQFMLLKDGDKYSCFMQYMQI